MAQQSGVTLAAAVCEEVRPRPPSARGGASALALAAHNAAAAVDPLMVAWVRMAAHARERREGEGG
jgi:hypothetical protein